MKYTAKFSTLLKKKPIQSDDLPEQEKIIVSAGQTYTINSVLGNRGLHRYVELSFEKGSWWIFLPHWEYDSEDRFFFSL